MMAEDVPIPDRQELERAYAGQVPRFEAILLELESRVRLGLESADFHPTVKCRVKSFGSYFKKKGKPESALFHFKAATKYFSPDTARAREITKQIESLKR